MLKTVLFQTIQFSIQKQFHFRQFSLVLVSSLNVKTVLFREIQFSISTQFSSIWPIERTVSGPTTPSRPETDGNEWVFRIPQSSSITRTSPSIIVVSYPEYSLEGVLPLCTDAVGVFYSPSWLGHRTLIGGVLLLCRDAVGVFYSPSWLGHRTLIGGVLPLCRDAVDVFYSPSWLGHRTLIGGVLLLCRDAIGVFYSPSWLDHRTLIGGVLPLCRDAVDVFYSPSWLGKRWKVDKTNRKISFILIIFLLLSTSFNPRSSSEEKVFLGKKLFRKISKKFLMELIWYERNNKKWTDDVRYLFVEW